MVRIAVVAQGRWIVAVSFLLLFAAYHLIFGQFFPTMNGTLGNDYAAVMPYLLNGYFWFKSNGFFEPFWFTPAFCGGQPELGEPGSIFYSVAQFLTFFINPLTSIYVTMLLFAALGFWGFYLLLRSCFGVSNQAAVLGGALFMFNGFFIHRLMVGHYMFHGVMLIPWIAYFLLRPCGKRVSDILLNGAVAGCMLAYCVYSGMAQLVLHCTVAVLAIICLHGLAGRVSARLLQRSLVAVPVSIGLSAAKLAATLSFLHNFPRSDYTLPGITSLWDAIKLLFSALFFMPPDIAEQAWPLIANAKWLLERHEWEYGITAVPLLIILAGTAVMLSHARDIHPRLSPARWAWLVLLGFVLALPLALNIYTPDWNAFLKQIPLIKSSSSQLRWFLVYIPAVILVAALFLDRISLLASRRNGMLAAALAALILINAVKDRNYYHSQRYRPDTIVNAWHAARDGTILPRIQYVDAFVDAYNQVRSPLNRNDMLAAGASQLVCYNPVFGYRLEHFPFKTLHRGPVLDETDGVLNIKNPACYLYPEQNNCTPGDHFTVAQRDAAQAFANYKPYPFNFSAVQQAANRVTLATLSLLAILFATALYLRITTPVKSDKF